MAVASSIIAASIIAASSTTAAVYSAKKQGDAAEKAAAVTQSSGDKALDFQKEELAYQKQKEADQLAYDRTQQAKREQQLAPYIGAGQQSLQHLNGLLGLEGAPAPGYAGPGGGTPPVTGKQGTFDPTANAAVPGALAGMAGNGAGTSAAGGLLAGGRPMAPTNPNGIPMGGAGTSLQGGGMVNIQAPGLNGEIRPVPSADVQHYLSLGGRVVN